MPHFNKIARLSHLERWLLLDALRRLIVARLGLWFLPLEKVRLLLPKSRSSSPTASLESVVWSVQTARRLVPQANCLVQAVATQSLLTNYGITSRLIIGVALAEQDNFKAHAWVECNGQVVIGESRNTQYQQLLTLDNTN